MTRFLFVKLLAALLAASLGAATASAQIDTIDPNNAGPSAPAPDAADQPDQSGDAEYQPVDSGAQGESVEEAVVAPTDPAASPSPSETASAAATATVPREDVFTAAEGVFGKGAKGLADMIEKLLSDQGEPTAYISGREAGGAFIAGLRYGSGVLHHQVEGDRPVFWTGHSLGFDFGANADKIFVLVYNLHDSQRLFRRYPAAEGNAYVVGGFTASYLRRGDTVLIPVRLGVGARLGVNAGYLRFSQKNRWLPF